MKRKKQQVHSIVENKVGYIIFNRSDNFNTFNLKLAEEFLEIIDTFNNDASIRAIVIKGQGKVFSAGGDINEMLDYVKKGEDKAAYFRKPLKTFGKMNLSLRESPKPVLAAVHGSVAGVAFNLMLSCDLIIAAEGTKFTQAFVKIGLSPDGGGTFYLPKLVGYARACELAMLPTIITSEKALDWGLINFVVPTEIFEAEIKRVAEQLASGPTLTIGKTKALLNCAHHELLMTQIDKERKMQIENASSKDHEEGLTAFIEKRQPRFEGI